MLQEIFFLFQFVFGVFFLIWALGIYGNVRRTRVATEKLTELLGRSESVAAMPAPTAVEMEGIQPTWSAQTRRIVLIGIVVFVTSSVLYAVYVR